MSLAIPLLPYYLCKTAANSADKLIVSYSFGKTYLARYSVAASIGLAPYFLVTALSYAVSPWIMRKLAKSEYEKIKYTVTSLCLLILSAITLITVFGKEALSFLAPEEFSDSIGAIYPLGLSIIPAFLIQTVGTVATYENKTRITSVAAVTGTAVGVLSELILAQFGVYTLTSFGALIINLTTLIAVLFLFKDGRRIIESRKIFSLFLLSCVLMIISFIFRENLSLRLLLAIPPSLALVRIASGITEQITE